MNKFLALLSVLVLGLVLAAQQTQRQEEPGEKMKGSWTVVSMESKGSQFPAEVVKDQTFSFDGKAITIVIKDTVKKGTYKLDWTASPAHLDVVMIEGEKKGKQMNMICQIDGDTLKIAMAPQNEYAKGFDDLKAIIMTLKRAKK